MEFTWWLVIGTYLWPNDATWHHRFGSTLDQVACLMLSHYLNQCRLIVNMPLRKTSVKLWIQIEDCYIFVWVIRIMTDLFADPRGCSGLVVSRAASYWLWRSQAGLWRLVPIPAQLCRPGSESDRWATGTSTASWGGYWAQLRGWRSYPR